ncbi:bacillithiol biosynthesis cysteine-adding enzyme BshC [Ekhidna lutea]|uniref:Putative cysteine ligase BshC n=1 Tax=Ekhidna lutea TaxID=447679 RepID=A0A239ERZ5_EKHLU|nr:bacillithiol biosynthesis cysteine-adding enzyme BshC [Ekhidna lutea]SNS47397.1 bacillithiol biosynthesis cysteine-adding enzyme BshC [Ekhidna lutea]
MRTETIPLDETDCFSPFFIDYINKKEELAPFYNAFPTIENFENAIENRQFKDETRSVLVEVLKEQYQGLDINSAVSQNIESLADSKTFTVTTGHQLNIFTGPLYFIYKIVTVINACKNLKQTYPDYNFVPVYWMASEDHDFEEINHFFFEGKKYEWETAQTGAVGHFDPSGLKEIADKLPSGAEFFKDAYSHKTLADAARAYVNHLFGDRGLVVVDADHAKLKTLFSHVIEDDLFKHAPEKLVSKTSSSLNDLGYKTQVHARQVNFFYLDSGIRERIEKTESGFQVVDADITFSDSEIRKLIQDYPERFSPNVILRPLYQETILPNLAYVGGPSEAVYWLQLKGVFDHFKTDFPLLMPRNFALVVPETAATKWGKTGLLQNDLFLTSEKAFEKWVKANCDHEISYEVELKKLKELEDSLKCKAGEIDPTLTQHIEALHASFSKRIGKAEKKLVRAEKRLHADRKRQIESVKEVLFPGGSLQERKDSFLNFYLHDPEFVNKLLNTFDAFDYRMYLMYL